MPEIGKTYLGKVVRIAEFGAFVEIFPGTDGLLHVSEIAEHRVKDVKDELREGDQILVKVLSIEGNRIKLSRKAVLREQRAKLGLPEVGEAAPASSYPAPIEEDEVEDGDETVLVEGGVDFEDEDGDGPADEPNFNRADGAPVPVANAGGRGPGGPSGFRGPGGPGGDRRPGGRRRRGGGGRRPGGPGGAPQGGGGNR